MVKTWGITYERVDFEVIPADLLGSGSPASPVRLTVGSYLPALVMVGSALLYRFYLVPIRWRSTKPVDDEAVAWTKSLRYWHNLALCIYSGFASFSTAYHVVSRDQLSYEAFMCTPVEGTWLRVVSVTFTLSKIWEWGDTAFIVWLGRRPPQFLHTYHHTTTFWLFCFVMNQPGAEKIGMLLNGFVHFLMYSHYWKPWSSMVWTITVLQIVQLCVCLWVYSTNHTACPDAVFSQDPRAYSLEFLSSYLTVPVFIVYFVKYFVERWVCPKARSKKVE